MQATGSHYAIVGQDRSLRAGGMCSRVRERQRPFSWAVRVPAPLSEQSAGGNVERPSRHAISPTAVTHAVVARTMGAASPGSLLERVCAPRLSRVHRGPAAEVAVTPE